MMKAYSIDDFGGVWQRMELFEPSDKLGPVEEQAPEATVGGSSTGKMVLWIQSTCGRFIDLRCPVGSCGGELVGIAAGWPQVYKAFAGTSTYDPSNSQIVWHRDFDFRFPGTPDVGSIRFRSENVIEEDVVLPGDDYCEIWHRLSGSRECSDFAASLDVVSATGIADTHALFLVVGDWFAITIDRPSSNAMRPQTDLLEQIFKGDYHPDISALPSQCSTGKLRNQNEQSIDSPAMDKVSIEELRHASEYIDGYIAVIGLTSDWIVQYSVGDPKKHQPNNISSIHGSSIQSQTLKGTSVLPPSTVTPTSAATQPNPCQVYPVAGDAVGRGTTTTTTTTTGTDTCTTSRLQSILWGCVDSVGRGEGIDNVGINSNNVPTSTSKTSDTNNSSNSHKQAAINASIGGGGGGGNKRIWTILHGTPLSIFKDHIVNY